MSSNVMTILIQSIYYSLLFTGVTYVLFFGDKTIEKSMMNNKNKICFFTLINFCINLFFNTVYVNFSIYDLLAHMFNMLFWLFILMFLLSESFTKVFIRLSSIIITIMLLEGVGLIPFMYLKDFFDIKEWNTGVITAALINFCLLFIFRYHIQKFGNLLNRISHIDLIMLLPIAALIQYALFLFRFIRTLILNTSVTLNIFIFVLSTIAVILYCFIQIRKISELLEQESRTAPIQLGKSIASRYLSNRHDIKNMLEALPYTTAVLSNDLNTPSALVNAILQLKCRELDSLDIKLKITAIHSENDFTKMHTLDDGHLEIKLTILLGILIDNSKEHLIAYPQLPRTIELVLDYHATHLRISNPINTNGLSHIKSAFDEGSSSKVNNLTSGFGLYNAQQLAKQLNRKLNYTLREDNIIFELK